MKYFYIIERSGTITEVPYTEENYKKAFEEWVNAGRLIVRPQGHSMPIGINAVDITNIFTEEAYKGYIESARIKVYLRDGIWYDVKGRGEVRVEPWKLRERNKRTKLAAPEPEKPPTPEMQKRIEKKKKEIRDMLAGNKK